MARLWVNFWVRNQLRAFGLNLLFFSAGYAFRSPYRTCPVLEADSDKNDVNSFLREPLMNDYYEGSSTHLFLYKGLSLFSEGFIIDM